MEQIKEKDTNINEEDFEYFWQELKAHPNQFRTAEKYIGIPREEVNVNEEYNMFKSFIKTWVNKWRYESINDVTPIASYDLNSKLENKKVKMKGMVYTITDVFNEIYGDIYHCSNCGEDFKVVHNQNIRRCELCNSIDGIKKSRELQRDFMEMELEEMPEEIIKQPGKVKIKMYNPLIYTEEIKHLQPGEVVNIIGTVKKDKVKVKNSREIFEYYLVLEAIELENRRDKREELSPEDVQNIIEISKDNPLDKLTKSLAPGIYDMEEIKKSIILQMVRGPEDNQELRARLHVLLVGSAGVAKSQLAYQAHKKTQRSIYGSGENMSKAGLSSSMVKDEIRGDWSVRAGILCRANKSLVVLDEFDKLSKEDMAGLHTPMEKGENIVSKAGVHLSLKADCSILACCNPKHGEFIDMSGYESIASQVNIPIPILNRFDLIFLLRDVVNEERDRKIIKSMFNKNAKPEVETDLFKKYIYFASQINPDIPIEVQEIIEDIYAKLRKSSSISRETKINPRIPRSIASLAVASAKIRLSNTVSLEDVKVAEDLMMASFKSLGFGNNLNSIDVASLYSTTSQKKLQLESKLRDLIKEKVTSCKDTTKRADWHEIKSELQDLGYAEKEVEKVFKILKEEQTLIGEDYRLVWV